MTANPYRGEYGIEIGGKAYVIAVDWQAIATLRSTFGEEWMVEVGAAIDGLDVERLATIVAITLQRHHPGEVTAEAIMDASPPLAHVSEALQAAVSRAFHGLEEPPEVGGKDPLPARLLMSLSRLFGSPGTSDSSRANSGA